MIRKTSNKSNRGSALLMIVGLLTILALLGGTFLIVSRYERKQAKALESSPEPDARAQDVADLAAAKLAEDLFITTGSTWPYTSGAASNDLTWRRFIDCPPAAVVDTTVDNDFWLASFAKNSSDVWPQLSRVIASTTTTNYIDKDGDFDCDGDAIPDSFTSDLNIALLNGNRYAASVRIIDLSGLLNVNTVGDSTTVLTESCPANINITGLKYTAGTTTYTINPNILTRITDGTSFSDTLYQGRNGTSNKQLQVYYDTCATKLGNVPTGFTPFPTSDEMYLRWLSVDNPQETGRLYNVTKDFSAGTFTPSLRKYLTTLSTSRSLLRHPDTSGTTGEGFTTRMKLTNTNIANTTLRTKLYNALVKAVDPTNADPDRRKQVAQYLVNLWSYTSEYDIDPTIVPAPTPTINDTLFRWNPFNATSSAGEPFTVYGIVPQLVISDVFAVQFQPTYITDAADRDTDSNGTEDTWFHGDAGYAYAVELFNPCSQAVDVSNYHMYYGGLHTDFTTLPVDANGKRLIAPNSSVVVYCVGGKDPSDTTVPKSANLTASSVFSFTGPNVEWPDLNFNQNSEELFLVRIVQGQTFVLDKVNPNSKLAWSTYNYNDNSQPAGAATYTDQNKSVMATALRDDNVTGTSDTVGRNRALIPEYVVSKVEDAANVSLTSVKTAARKLQVADNGITSSTLNYSACCGGFDLKVNYGDVSNFADLTNVFMVGPAPITGTPTTAGASTYETLPALLDSLKANPSDISRGKLNFKAPCVTTSEYPDVPWACLFSELTEVLDTEEITPDPTGHPTQRVYKVYGRININTAPKEVLMQLPLYVDLNHNGTIDAATESTDAIREDLVKAIIAYRENLPETINGFAFSRDVCGDSSTLRTVATYRGFLTPGEVALPLRTMAGQYAIANGFAENTPEYQMVANSTYKSIANLVTVNSDTYAVYIAIHLKKPLGNPQKLNSWRYLTILDRSNCIQPSDTPAVKLPLTRIK